MQATDAIEKAVIEASASLIEVISEISALKDERERIEPKGVEDFDNIKDNLINASLDIAHAISLMKINENIAAPGLKKRRKTWHPHSAFTR